MSVIDAAASAIGRAQRRSERFTADTVYDPVTGLIAASAFIELAAERISRCRGTCAVLVISARDTGDPAADERSLRTIASAIRSSIRPPDLAGHDDQGDLVIVLDRCDQEDARQVCSRILRAMYTATNGNGHVPAIGIAVAPNDGGDIRTLVRHARKEQRAPKRAQLAISTASA